MTPLSTYPTAFLSPLTAWLLLVVWCVWDVWPQFPSVSDARDCQLPLPPSILGCVLQVAPYFVTGAPCRPGSGRSSKRFQAPFPPRLVPLSCRVVPCCGDEVLAGVLSRSLPDLVPIDFAVLFHSMTPAKPISTELHVILHPWVFTGVQRIQHAVVSISGWVGVCRHCIPVLDSCSLFPCSHSRAPLLACPRAQPPK